MAYQQKDNSGSLFKNDRKESDTHPDYKGPALIGGIEHWLDAWINETSDGRKYMSVKFKPKDAQGGGGTAPRTNRSFETDLEDDVPFISSDPAFEARVR